MGDQDIFAKQQSARARRCPMYPPKDGARARAARFGQTWLGCEGIVLKVTLLFERDDDGTYIVSDDVTVVYGVGDTPQAALGDYAVSMSEYFEILAEYNAKQ
jgi:hypothetical protein